MNLIAIFVVGLLSISQCLAQDEVVDASSTTSVPDQLSSFYTAAVVELYPPGNDLTDPEDVVEANLAEYLRLVYEASSKGADILVFPEATLNYIGINSQENLTATAVDISMEVPNTSDCVYTQNVILEELSFAASNASIYLLVNLIEKEPCGDTDQSCKNGYKLFNTNVAFDRNGCIVSRYRKFNLFLEPFMAKPEKPEHATFETDFGVTFGHVVCFDLMFKSPVIDLVNMGISHILYPTAWYQETPSLTANQIQQGFAQGSNVVLLASGANQPDQSNTGSGIYIGRHGAVERIISYKKETRMFIAEIPKDVNDPEFEAKDPSLKPYSPSEMEGLFLSNYNWSTTELSHQKKAPMENVVCEFTLNYTHLDSHDGYTYRLVTFNGIRPYVNITTGGEAHCTIVSCMDDATCAQKFGDKTSSVKFHEIEISMTITEGIEDFHVMPTTLDNSLNVLSPKLYKFSKESDGNVHKFTIRSNEVAQSMLTFGIYARHFSLDGQPLPVETVEHGEEFADCTNEKENSVRSVKNIDDSEDLDFTIKMVIYVVLMIFLSIITAIMTYKKLQTPYIKPNQNKRKSVNFA